MVRQVTPYRYRLIASRVEARGAIVLGIRPELLTRLWQWRMSFRGFGERERKTSAEFFNMAQQELRPPDLST